MKSAKAAFWIALAVAIFITVIILGNLLLTELIYRTNELCPGQSFSSVEDAIKAMAGAADPDDTSLDYSPPYKLLTSFEYDEFTVVMYSYEEASENECAVRMLRCKEDGTLSFVGGFTDFHFSAPDDSNTNYYYYANVKTSHGMKSVCFLYLPDDTSGLYVDGNKAEKISVNINGEDFFVCAVMSEKDTFLKNACIPIQERHTIEIKAV